MTRTLFALMAAYCAFINHSYAEFLTSIDVTSETLPTGLFHYQYTVTNLPSSDANIISFEIKVSSDADLQSITGPDGWLFNYSTGFSDFLVSTYDPANYNPITPGRTATFSFDSVLAPSLLDYDISSDFDAQNVPKDNTGQIFGPGIRSVPEPMSMIPLVTGAVLVGGYTLLRRRSSG